MTDSKCQHVTQLCDCVGTVWSSVRNRKNIFFAFPIWEGAAFEMCFWWMFGVAWHTSMRFNWQWRCAVLNDLVAFQFNSVQLLFSFFLFWSWFPLLASLSGFHGAFWDPKRGRFSFVLMGVLILATVLWGSITWVTALHSSERRSEGARAAPFTVPTLCDLPSADFAITAMTGVSCGMGCIRNHASAMRRTFKLSHKSRCVQKHFPRTYVGSMTMPGPGRHKLASSGYLLKVHSKARSGVTNISPKSGHVKLTRSLEK